MPCCEISDCAQMSKTIIAVRHIGLGGRESLETAVRDGSSQTCRSGICAHLLILWEGYIGVGCTTFVQLAPKI